MSLAVNATTPEGIVLAADSRQSYRNRKKMARIGSDNASKLFQINNRIGVVAVGQAFLPENNVLKGISKFIEEFRRQPSVQGMEVSEVAKELNKRFNAAMEPELQSVEDTIRKECKEKGYQLLDIARDQNIVRFKFRDQAGEQKNGQGNVNPVTLMIAGYNKDGSHNVFESHSPGGIEEKRNSNRQGIEYGANWIGQHDVVTRIVLGFDWRIGRLSFMPDVAKRIGEEQVRQQLSGLEYAIEWGTMALQDAVDFCILMIETTAAMQRFSDGIRIDQGDMPGVGGPIDVAIITEDKGFVWIRRKKIGVGSVESDVAAEQAARRTTSKSGSTASRLCKTHSSEADA